MGTSNVSNIPYVIKNGIYCNPSSILDIGCGFGKYGALFREYTDVWKGRPYPHQWEVIIDGVEAFSKYIHSGHLFYYNKIYKKDIFELIEKNLLENTYDLILWIDGPEHMEKNKAKYVIDYLYKEKCNKTFILTHPNIQDPEIALKQGAANKNKYECHVSIWSKMDFIQYSPLILNDGKVVVLNKVEINHDTNID